MKSNSVARSIVANLAVRYRVAKRIAVGERKKGYSVTPRAAAEAVLSEARKAYDTSKHILIGAGVECPAAQHSGPASEAATTDSRPRQRP